MAKITCNYQFPIHPSDMFSYSKKMNETTRLLRVQMIENIVLLSQTYDQHTINNKVFVDVKDGKIIGMDMSELTIPKFGLNICRGKRVSLQHMSSLNWKTMQMT